MKLFFCVQFGIMFNVGAPTLVGEENFEPKKVGRSTSSRWYHHWY